ncbi:MAG: HNH endonuclease [Candidatus Gastranaerophilales bacterium]|nr:HNH endonuclease [Candidatus Gastranaerophilales bacterium]
MVISAVSSVNTYNNTGFQTNPIERKHETAKLIVPMMNRARVEKSSGEALRSYFMGGQAATMRGIPCSTGDFAIKKLDDVPCCCCGDRMIRGQEMPHVVHSFSELKGSALADKIEKDKDYFRANQRAAAMIIADEARKDENLDVSEAFDKAKNNLQGKIKNYCTNVLTNLNEVAAQAYGREDNPMSALALKEIENVKNGKIARVPFTEKLEQLKGDLPLEKYEKVLDTAMNLPEGMRAVEKIFTKQKGADSSAAIINKLLTGALHTAEHVHPKSLGGPNSTANYLGECALCNNPRGNMSYAQWLKIHPEYPIKVQEHIEYVEQKIVDGEIPAEYDSYPVDINETLTKESNGMMTLKVLNPEKIRELREQRLAGKEVNVSEVTKEIFDKQEEEREETQAA